MEEEFVKEHRIKELTAKDKDEDIIKNVIKAKAELECAINNFEYAEKIIEDNGFPKELVINYDENNFEYAENDLIDYFSYQIKANQAKLDYLLKKAKRRGILLSMIEEIKMKTKKAI